MGPAAPTPTPIGGLRTRPLNAPVPVGEYRRPGQDRRPGSGYREGFRDGYRYGNGYGPGIAVVYGLGSGVVGNGVGDGVVDAPLPRGSAVYEGITTASPRARAWYPTGDTPRWRVDSTLVPVQAWRDLIVNDVVCDGAGTCMEREQRVRAPWVATCRCYLFTDALGRRWEVVE